MNFGQALEALKAGKRVARDGWDGKGMWLALVKARVPSAHPHLFAESLVRIPEEPVRMGERDVAFGNWLSGEASSTLRLLPWIGMKTADDGFVPWLASQTDLLAEDWQVLS